MDRFWQQGNTALGDAVIRFYTCTDIKMKADFCVVGELIGIVTDVIPSQTSL